MFFFSIGSVLPKVQTYDVKTVPLYNISIMTYFRKIFITICCFNEIRKYKCTGCVYTKYTGRLKNCWYNYICARLPACVSRVTYMNYVTCRRRNHRNNVISKCNVNKLDNKPSRQGYC